MKISKFYVLSFCQIYIFKGNTNLKYFKMNKKILPLLPIMFGFFIMAFCDVVGIASSFMQKDFGLTDSGANLIGSMVFIWFFFFSVPVGILMNKIGRKNTVMLSMVFTFVAMLIPFIQYSYVTCLVAFAILGIGNTILQVSLNPLVANLVSGKGLTSALSAGQFVKAISSALGPIIAIWAGAHLGGWQMIFPIYAAITLISSVWLLMTDVPKEQNQQSNTSLLKVLALLGDKKILLLFGGIFFVVGVDVGMNMTAPKLLAERCGMAVEDAGYGSTIYFIFRTIGAFLGAIILAKFSGARVFQISIVGAIAAAAVLYFAQDATTIYIAIGAIGLLIANVFSIIFSVAIQHLPNKANEVSGLMVMGVSGGAVLPWLMGKASDSVGLQTGAVIVLGLCMVYLLATALTIKDVEKA